MTSRASKNVAIVLFLLLGGSLLYVQFFSVLYGRSSMKPLACRGWPYVYSAWRPTEPDGAEFFHWSNLVWDIGTWLLMTAALSVVLYRHAARNFRFSLRAFLLCAVFYNVLLSWWTVQCDHGQSKWYLANLVCCRAIAWTGLAWSALGSFYAMQSFYRHRCVDMMRRRETEDVSDVPSASREH
jgi:hypothetical protein